MAGQVQCGEVEPVLQQEQKQKVEITIETVPLYDSSIHAIEVEGILDFLLSNFMSWEEFVSKTQKHDLPSSQSFSEIAEGIMREGMTREPLVSNIQAIRYDTDKSVMIHHIFFKNLEDKLLFILKYGDEITYQNID